jgi:type IV secretory pathway TrbD component
MPTPKPKRRPVDFAALAGRSKPVSGPTRALVLLVLGEGERSAGELATEIGFSVLQWLRKSFTLIPWAVADFDASFEKSV